MSDYAETLIVALVQGVTEFLPISSSGHVVIAQALFGQDLEQGVTFNIITHFGTLVSIVYYFRKDLAQLLSAGWRALREPSRIRERWQNEKEIRFIAYLLISMIPAGVAGFTIRERLDGLFADPAGISFMFLVTGALLYSTRYFYGRTGPLTAGNTFLVGVAQAFALIPGLSRSGTTMSAAILLGINKEDVARFTFIMMIPVVTGATLVELLGLQGEAIDPTQIPHLILGFLVAMLSGYVALKYFIVLFKTKGIHYFAYYCWGIGMLGLWYFL